MTDQFGPIDLESPAFDFTFTSYYEAEMGTDLKKVFWSFERHIQPDALVDAKLFTNDVEQQFLIDGRRTVNLDPGYISHGNLVLATTKNFAHRVYLGKGIYGDVHLIYRHNAFHKMEWTYPDYQQPLVVSFFQNVRNKYRTTIKGQ